MVMPHQCMKPATSTQVSSTHSITNTEPRQLPAGKTCHTPDHDDVSTQCDQGGHEDADNRDAHILKELHTDNGVSLPVDVSQGDGKAFVRPANL